METIKTGGGQCEPNKIKMAVTWQDLLLKWCNLCNNSCSYKLKWSMSLKDQ